MDKVNKDNAERVRDEIAWTNKVRECEKEIMREGRKNQTKMRY